MPYLTASYLELLWVNLCCINIKKCPSWASLVVQMVKSLPAIQETWVQYLAWEDPLEKEMATHSSILAWKIPWIEDPGGLHSIRLQRVGHDWVTNRFSCKIAKQALSFRISSSYLLRVRAQMLTGNCWPMKAKKRGSRNSETFRSRGFLLLCSFEEYNDGVFCYFKNL